MDDEILDNEGAMGELGISRSTLYVWALEDGLPYTQRRGKRLYLKSELIAFVREGLIRRSVSGDRRSESVRAVGRGAAVSTSAASQSKRAIARRGSGNVPPPSAEAGTKQRLDKIAASSKLPAAGRPRVDTQAKAR